MNQATHARPLPTAVPAARRFDARAISPWLFLSPYLLLTAVFFVYPVLSAVQMAFYQSNGTQSFTWVGLDNFFFILRDPDFWTAMRNTVTFTVGSIFLQLPLSLGLAMMLNTRQSRLKNVFRLACFSPHLVGSVFVGILFAALFTPSYGLFNRGLHMLIGWGLEEQWLGDPRLVMPAIIIASLWMYIGFNMIYFLAALQNVDQSLVEAARIDGAGPFQTFMNVVVPSIKPVIVFVVVMSTIGSFNLFELPYALLSGPYGPNNSGLTMIGYLYANGIEGGDLGIAAAVGWVLTLVILTLNLLQLKLSGAGKD